MTEPNTTEGTPTEPSEKPSISDALMLILRAAMSAQEYADLRQHIANGSVPAWIAGFLYFSKFLDEDACFLEFSIKGLEFFLMRAEAWAEKSPERLKNRAVSYVVASEERKRSFHGLHSRHVVSLWNMVDATLTECLVRLLVEHSSLLQLDELRKISFSVAQYQSLSQTELMRLTVAELKRLKGLGRNSKGVRVYEEIFSDLGLSPHLTDADDRLLIELRATRNVIVHNMSIADERFLENCPWLKLTLGTTIKVDAAKCHQYREAASSYVANTLISLMRKFHPSP